MADVEDIMDAWSGLISASLYPEGAPSAGTPSPVVGAVVAIESGWPEAAQVDTAMAAGSCIVSLFERPEERVTSRLRQAQMPLSQAPAGTHASVNGNVVTFSGTPTATETIGLMLKAAPGTQGDMLDVSFVLDTSVLSPANNFDGITRGVYGYGVQAGDDAAAVAAAFAADIPGAVAVGAVLTLPCLEVTVNIEGAWAVLTELKRQEKLFQITCWAPTPPLRKALGKAVDAVLATNYRMLVNGGTETATTRYGHARTVDDMQKIQVYRRDLFYFAEFATTAPSIVPAVAAPFFTLTPQ